MCQPLCGKGVRTKKKKGGGGGPLLGVTTSAVNRLAASKEVGGPREAVGVLDDRENRFHFGDSGKEKGAAHLVTL